MFATIMKSMGMSFGMCAVLAAIFLVASVFWVRTKVKDSVYILKIAANKQLSGKLLKPQSNTVIDGKGDDAPKFLIHPGKQFWSFWPPGFPHQIQEPVPTYLYVEGNAEPLDPYDRKSLITPESLRKISDEAMLKQTWKDVRETLGLKGKFGDYKTLMLLIIISVAMSAVAAYMAFTGANQISTILHMFGG